MQSIEIEVPTVKNEPLINPSTSISLPKIQFERNQFATALPPKVITPVVLESKIAQPIINQVKL